VCLFLGSAELGAAVLCCAVPCCAMLCHAVLCTQIEWLTAVAFESLNDKCCTNVDCNYILLISDAEQTLFVPQVYWAQRTGKFVVTPDW